MVAKYPNEAVPKSAANHAVSGRAAALPRPSLKMSKEAVDEKQDEVITFRDFFHDQIRARRPALLVAR